MCSSHTRCLHPYLVPPPKCPCMGPTEFSGCAEILYLPLQASEDGRSRHICILACLPPPRAIAKVLILVRLVFTFGLIVMETQEMD